MAGEIDLVIGTEAFAQINKLLTELGKVDASFTELASKFATLGNNTSTIKNTADLAKLTAENAKLNTVIEQQIKDFSDLNEKLAKVNTTRTSATKGITEETIAQRELNRETTLNIKATTEIVGAYAKLDAQYRQSLKTTQDLAAANKQNTQQYKDSLKSTLDFSNQLKKIDSDVGKHTRNVGNYASSWNGLGNSINQITREAPAFANSVQTGFMALSNNLPILSDEITQIIAKNKVLASNGEKTSSVFNQVAGAFFSWQTAMSLGVTLITVYGAKLWQLATAGGEASKNMKALSEANAQGTKEAGKEIGQLDLLYRTANNVSLSTDQRKKAVDKMQEVYPSYFKNLSAETIMNGEAKDAYYDLRDGILASARAKAISAKLDENAIGRFDKETAINTALEKSRKELIAVKKSTSDNYDIIIGGGSVVGGGGTTTRVTKKEQLANIYKDIKKHNQDLADLASEALRQDSFFLKEQEKLDKKAAKVTYDRTRVKEAKVDKTTEKTQKAERVDIKLVSELQEVDILLNRINAEIERLKVEKITANTEELPAVSFQLEQLLILRKQLNELPSVDFKIAIPPEDVEGIKKQSKEVENYLKSFATEFASKSGMSETFSMLSGEIEGFGTDAQVTFVAVAESAQEMFALMNQSSEANFQAEFDRLDKQKNAALEFAGTSEVAKAKIEEDFAKKKHEIEVRQFKEKQKITIANIAIDTAQAIVSTWAQVPKFDFGLSATALSVMIGAMGAVQAGIVLAQKPPAYAEGTDNHSGGLMLVNDGSGSNFQEKVILPSGKVIMPQGRNVLMDAPKGTKVLNHEQQLFEMLQNNNISMSTPIQNGLTYEEMNEIFQSNFANIKTQNTIFDKNGFQSYVKNGNSITRSNSNRSQAIGISV